MRLEEEVELLREENKRLQVLLERALARITELEAQLEQATSLTPAPFVKPSTQKKEGKEKATRRKRAKDQNGARRRDTPTETTEHKLQECPTCAYPLRYPRLVGQRQVIELPPPVPVQITEHQLYKSWCARCSKWRYACVDLHEQVVGQSRMGVRIASLVAYLRTTLRMPVRLIREYLSTMHNLSISTGEVVDLLHRVAEVHKVKVTAQAIKERVRKSGVVHGDETGWREKGQNGYVWCFCTSEGERYYEYDRSRAGAVARRILGSSFKGTLVTDFYVGYNDLPCEHQRCWVHLLRDLHELKEQHKENEQVLEWATEVRKMYDTAEQRLRCEGAYSGQGPPTQVEREVLYIELTEGVRELGNKYAQAKPYKQHPCHALCKRLLRHQDELFRFVLVPGLSADNNLAERSIRPLVVMRKVSGGSQSERGSRTRMTLASLFGTWRAKGLNPFTECLFLLSQPLSP